jgi:hypothetical protein
MNLRQVRGQRSSLPAARRRGLPEVPNSCSSSLVSLGTHDDAMARSVDRELVGRRQVYLKMANYRCAASMSSRRRGGGGSTWCASRSPRTGNGYLILCPWFLSCAHFSPSRREIGKKKRRHIICNNLSIQAPK